MRHVITIVSLGLLLLFAATTVVAEGEEVVEQTSVWVGMSYKDTTGHAKKVGEYNLLEESAHVLPEFMVKYLSQRESNIFRFDARYIDYENMNGTITAVVGDQFRGEFEYRSLTRQSQQDLLLNAEAREWLPVTSSPSGKMITHELQDEGVGYNYQRQELLSRLQVLLSDKNNVRLVAAHRSVLKQGNEQKISANHCFSCHLTSKEARINSSTHHIEAGIDAEVDQYDVGYRFGYRLYENDAPDPTAYYDPGKHPVNGGSVAEFRSRLAYEDTTLVYGAEPKTEKISHKLRLKGDVGSWNVSGTVSHARALNKNTELASRSWMGVLNLAHMLSPRTRLLGTVKGVRTKSDDVLIDLPSYRQGRPGPVVDFDFVRASYLDRAQGEITAEVVHKLNPRWTLSFLGGYERIDRYNYPSNEDNLVTNRVVLQAKAAFTKGTRYSSRIKYRFEKTSDPLVSARGLFEGNGSVLLDGLPGSPSDLVLYFQREAIKYQDITTEPTDRHEVQWQSTWRPSDMATVNIGLNLVYDKNGDLDSLDVSHFTLQPNAALTYIPNPRWSLTGGVNHYHNKSRGPLAVALFDG